MPRASFYGGLLSVYWSPLNGQLAAANETSIDVIICHAYSVVRIETGHYLGPANYSYIYFRYRTDNTVQLVNYET